jgi:hypothetical protein
MNKKKRNKPYAHQQEISFIIPIQFLLICRLLKVEPRKVLYQFMCNLAHEAYSNGTEQKIVAKEYFLSCGYGLELYTDGEIEQIFDELDNIAALWSNGGPVKLLNLHRKWRNRYYKYWYKKWHCMFRSTLKLTITRLSGNIEA